MVESLLKSEEHSLRKGKWDSSYVERESGQNPLDLCFLNSLSNNYKQKMVEGWGTC
jgi:hypothetical protein